MARVTIVVPQFLNVELPQQASGIDVQGAEHVFAFDEDASAGDLWHRSVAVTRQDRVVARTAKPQQAKRRLDEFVGRHDGVARVGILVRPVGGAWQSAFSADGYGSPLVRHDGAGERGGFQHQFNAGFVRAGDIDLSAVGTDTFVDSGEFFCGEALAIDEDHLCQIGRQARGGRGGDGGRHAMAVDALGEESGSQGSDFGGIGIQHD